MTWICLYIDPVVTSWAMAYKCAKIEVLLTSTQKERIRLAAEKRGRTISSWVRLLALRNAHRVRMSASQQLGSIVRRGCGISTGSYPFSIFPFVRGDCLKPSQAKEANRTPSQAEDEEGQVPEVREPVERTERVEDRGPVERIEDPAASAVEETFVRHHEIGTSPDLALRPPAVNGRRRRSLN
jgi:hypothetical protein